MHVILVFSAGVIQNEIPSNRFFFLHAYMYMNYMYFNTSHVPPTVAVIVCDIIIIY